MRRHVPSRGCLNRELAEIVFVEAALSVGGPLKRKGPCDVDFKGAGIDQMIKRFKNLTIGLSVVALCFYILDCPSNEEDLYFLSFRFGSTLSISLPARRRRIRISRMNPTAATI